MNSTTGDLKLSAKYAMMLSMSDLPNRSPIVWIAYQKSIKKLNHDLPVTAEADTLIQAIRDHQVVIIAGETGSGKTTQLPKLAMMAGRGITGQIATHSHADWLHAR